MRAEEESPTPQLDMNECLVSEEGSSPLLWDFEEAFIEQQEDLHNVPARPGCVSPGCGDTEFPGTP